MEVSMAEDWKMMPKVADEALVLTGSGDFEGGSLNKICAKYANFTSSGMIREFSRQCLLNLTSCKNGRRCLPNSMTGYPIEFWQLNIG